MDPDPGDIVSITFSMMFNVAIPSFITIKDNSQIILNPTGYDIGIHRLIITLADNEPLVIRKYSNYLVIIDVLRRSNVSPINITVPTTTPP